MYSTEFVAKDKNIIKYWSVTKKAHRKYTEKTKHFQNTRNAPADADNVPLVMFSGHYI